MLVSTITTFKRLFSGNNEAYGVYIPPTTDPQTGAKEEGQSFTKKEELRDQCYVDHLNGTTGLGICPVDAEGHCKFTVIDVDVYDSITTKYILDTIQEYNMPIKAFKSKSGGLHLYTFYEEVVSAKQAIENAQYMRRCLCLPSKTEVFPKQLSLKDGKKGNWINLPYFGGDKTKRALLQENGEPCQSIDVAISDLERSEITTEKFTAWKESLPLSDAPPCLQGLYMSGVEENRNQFVFNMAVYYKAKFGADQFSFYVEEANGRLRKPLTEKELNDTVVSSVTKNSYTYRCKEAPICDFCDKKECRNREFSYSGGKVSSLSYESFRQFTVDPPYYEWTISGKVLRFYSEIEIIQQDKFLALCFRHLGILPPKLKREVWEDILNTALSNMEVVNVDKSEDITNNGIIRSYVVKYLKETKCEDMAKLLIGRTYFKKSNGFVYFKGVDLVRYVTLHANCNIDKRELMAWLLEKGAENMVMKVNGKSVRVYGVPYSSFNGVDDDTLDAGTPIAQEAVERINWTEEANKLEGDL